MLTRVVFLCFLVSLTQSMHTTTSSSENRSDGIENTSIRQKNTAKKKVSFNTEWKAKDSMPRFGFGDLFNSTNLLPNVNPGSPSGGTGGSVPSGGGLESIFGGNNNFGLPGTVGTVGASAVLVSEPKSLFKSLLKRRVLAVKGGFLTLLTAIKSIVVPALVTLLLIAFLIAGAAYFTCSVVDCQGSLGALTRGGVGANSALGDDTPFIDRNTFGFYDDQLHSVYQAIDEGHQKYGTPLQGHGNSVLGLGQ